MDYTGSIAVTGKLMDAFTNLNTLFKKIKASPEKFTELYKLVKTKDAVETIVESSDIELPKDFKSIIGSTSLTARKAYKYLKKRNLTNLTFSSS